MKTDSANMECLLSDEVFLEGALASDVQDLVRRLGRMPKVRRVARSLAGERDRIEELCAFVRDELAVEYDSTYRHPHDIGICAALVILRDSPLSCARNLFAQLRMRRVPSLAWIKRVADYYEQTFIAGTRPLWVAGAGPAFASGPVIRDVDLSFKSDTGSNESRLQVSAA